MSKEIFAKLDAKRKEASLGGGQDRIDKIHEENRLTARERILYLLDEGSFEEFDMFKKHRSTDFEMEKKHFPGDGVVRPRENRRQTGFCFCIRFYNFWRIAFAYRI